MNQFFIKRYFTAEATIIAWGIFWGTPSTAYYVAKAYYYHVAKSIFLRYRLQNSPCNKTYKFINGIYEKDSSCRFIGKV